MQPQGVTIFNYYFTDEDNCIIVETSELYFLLVLEINETMSKVHTGLYKY